MTAEQTVPSARPQRTPFQFARQLSTLDHLPETHPAARYRGAFAPVTV